MVSLFHRATIKSDPEFSGYRRHRTFTSQSTIKRLGSHIISNQAAISFFPRHFIRRLPNDIRQIFLPDVASFPMEALLFVSFNNTYVVGPIANLKVHYFQPSLSVSLSVCL